MSRRVNVCVVCDEEREIVSNGLCAKCNMRVRRQIERMNEPDWAPGRDAEDHRARRKQDKLRMDLAKVVAILNDQSLILPEDVQAIKNILVPYFTESIEALRSRNSPV